MSYYEGDGDARKHLYETAVFAGPDDLAGIERHEYSSIEGAKRGHHAIVARYQQSECSMTDTATTHGSAPDAREAQ